MKRKLSDSNPRKKAKVAALQHKFSESKKKTKGLRKIKKAKVGISDTGPPELSSSKNVGGGGNKSAMGGPTTWYINGKAVSVLVDTGSEVSLISEDLAKDLGMKVKNRSGTDTKVEGILGGSFNIVGEWTGKVVKYSTKPIPFIPMTVAVVKTEKLEKLLIGKDMLERLGIQLDFKSG